MKKFQRWYKLSFLGRCVLSVMVFQMTVFPCLPSLNAVAFAREGNTTLGARVGDDQVHGFVDMLIPVWQPSERGLLFFNPRFSAGQFDTDWADGDEQELSLGLGLRNLVSINGFDVILGANAYYDTRWTVHDNTFNQYGFGLEFLSEWVDARGNYYITEDDPELVGSYDASEMSWADLSASRHSIWQERITAHHIFEQYEAPLEGYDAEIGVKLPYISDFAETRVFLGYQNFESEFGDDLEGMKARLEVRVLPGLMLDAEYFEEDDLNETDYLVGLRVQVPFDIGNIFQGKNPFAGTVDKFKRAEDTPLSDRLTEMVIRDMAINTEISGFKENQTFDTTESVLLTDTVTFVDGGATGTPDGTYELPWGDIQDGVDNSGANNIVVVGDTGVAYEENVVVSDNVHVYGRYPGNDANYLGERPTVLGDGNSPTVTMGENTTVAGFVIRSQGSASGAVSINSPNEALTIYDVTRAGIASENNSNLVISDNVFKDVTYGAVLVDTLTSANDAFIADIANNQFNDCEDDGLVIDTLGASGTFDVTVTGGEFSRNDGSGLFIDARTYDHSSLAIDGATADYNGDDGIYINLEDNDVDVSLAMNEVTATANGGYGIRINNNEGGVATLTMTNVAANSNDYSGIWFYNNAAYSDDGDATATFDGVTASFNGEYGIYFYEEAAYSDAGGDATLTMTNVAANHNDYVGVYFYYEAASAGGGNATATFNGVTASNNGSYGIAFMDWGTNSGIGDSTLSMSNVTTNDNGESGIWFYYSAAYAQDGDATATFDGVTASFNTYYGMYFGEEAAYSHVGGDATLTMTNVTANYNGSSGIYFYLTAAYARSGSATATFDGVTANHNLSSGIYFYDHGAYSEAGGNATLTMSNVNANYNGYYGIYFLEPVQAAAGDATLTMTDVSASYNGAYGIYFEGGGAYSEDGNATATFDGLTVSHNGGYGIFFDYSGAYSDANGDAYFRMTNVDASFNDYSGIYFYEAGAYAQDGNATAIFSDITATDNGYVGIGFGAYGAASDTNGDATFSMTNVNVSANYDDGMYFDYRAAYAEDGNAVATFVGVTANHNGGYGVYISSHGAHSVANGNATFTMSNTDASNNYESGVYFGYYAAYAEGGSATATFDGVTANDNDGTGLYGAGAFTLGAGGASTQITNSEFSDNGYDGLYVEMYSGSGTVSVWMQNDVVIYNGDDGVEVNASGGAYDLNMGDATAGTAGYNSIYGNNMNAGLAYDLNNSGSGTVMAEDNWWGTTTPVAGQFNGTVDYDPLLNSDPN